MPDSERAAFIDAILNNPADDTARLVFADWLEEHGESERAEFIRCQINPESLPESVRERSDPSVRIAGKHGAALGGGWRKAIGISETEGEYVRGFLTGVGIDSTPGFLDLTDAVLALEPVMFEVQLRPWRRADPKSTSKELREIAAVANSRNLRAVTRLWRRPHMYSEPPFGSEQFALLMGSPYLCNLREISVVDDSSIGIKGVQAIANAPTSFTLESLTVNGALTGFGSEALHILATAPRFATLQSLSLSENELTSDDIRVLLDSKTLPRNLALDLSRNSFYHREFTKALAERFGGDSDDDEEAEYDDYGD